MKKAESFCTACEWQGDGTGLACCPICGEPITTLDVGDEQPSVEEYPADLIEENKDVKDL